MAIVIGPVVVNAVTLTAGAGDVTSDTLQVTPHGAVTEVWLENGATGPTVAAQVQVQVSETGAKWASLGGALVGGVANNGIYSWGGVEIPSGTKQARFVSGSNTDEDVTVTIHAGMVA